MAFSKEAKLLIKQGFLLREPRSYLRLSLWSRALCVAACAEFFSANGVAAPSPSTETNMPSSLTSANNGGTFELRVGHEVVIRLPENPSTGYRWAVEMVDATLVKIEEEEFVPASKMVGGGGEAQWLLKAEAPGETAVKFKRWRHWEGERSVTERYEITLRIVP